MPMASDSLWTVEKSFSITKADLEFPYNLQNSWTLQNSATDTELKASTQNSVDFVLCVHGTRI